MSSLIPMPHEHDLGMRYVNFQHTINMQGYMHDCEMDNVHMKPPIGMIKYMECTHAEKSLSSVKKKAINTLLLLTSCLCMLEAGLYTVAKHNGLSLDVISLI